MHLVQVVVFLPDFVPDPSCPPGERFGCPVGAVDVFGVVAGVVVLGASFLVGDSIAGCGALLVVVVCAVGPAPGDLGPKAVAASGCDAGKFSQWHIAFDGALKWTDLHLGVK